MRRIRSTCWALAGSGHAAAAPPSSVMNVRRFTAQCLRCFLLTRLDLVFMDTTSLSFEGAGGQTLGQHGYSKDHDRICGR
jgi:hypothetical protein